MIRQDEARWRSRAAVVLDVHPGAHDAESFEVAVEAAASVTARLVRLRRRVEVVTSAGEVLGTGGDPRHDVIDTLATVGPDDADRLPSVLENLRAHRRVDLVVVILGRVTPDTLHALARSPASASSSCSPAPPPSLPPRPGSWSTRRLRRSRRHGTRPSPARRSPARAPHHGSARPLPRAVRAGGAERGRRALAGARRRLRPLRAARCWRGPPPARPRRAGAAAQLAGVGGRAPGPRRRRGLRAARARAVDHHARTPERRHVARARPPAHRRVAPAPHRAGARARHRRRHPARGARGVVHGRDRRLARVRTASDARRDLARAGVLRVDVDARHQRLARAAHRRVLRHGRRVPPRPERRRARPASPLVGLAAGGAPAVVGPGRARSGAPRCSSPWSWPRRSRAPAPIRCSTSPTPVATIPRATATGPRSRRSSTSAPSSAT